MRRARRLTGYSKVRTSDFILDPSSTHRITQYIAEDSLEGMKDVVRKKLGLATSASIYFSQLRDESVDLEDGMFCHRKASIPCSVLFPFSSEGDFEAFRAFVRTTGAAQISVSYNKPNPAPGPLGEFTSTAISPLVDSSGPLLRFLPLHVSPLSPLSFGCFPSHADL